MGNPKKSAGSIIDRARPVARKYALMNALKHGSAEPGRLIGKIVGEIPELKKDIGSLREIIGEIVLEVNKLSKESIESEIIKSFPEMLEKKPEQKKELPELNTHDSPVIMRFEPSPSGPLHIGHAYVLSLISAYSRRYPGKLILRLADTNPSKIDPIAYEQIPKDAEWLTGSAVSEVIIQSGNMDTYYSHALEMLNLGAAYICTCSAESFREMAQKKEECSCRSNPPEKNLDLWKLMFTKFSEGESVMRFRTDMKHKNPAMRDFPLMRITDDEHPMQGRKYRVWPLMNFAVSVDDYTEGITHILRAKDHADNAKRQQYIQHAMGWPVPQTQFVGRINFLDLEVSCSKTKIRMDAGEFSGWDDIRLPFIVALKRRGFQPGAFLKYALSVGVSLADKKVSKEEFFKALNAFNKEVIDPASHRQFFVEDPVEITLKGAPAQRIELDLHPDTKKGGRRFTTGTSFFIARSDLEAFNDGEMIRLMDCLNFRKTGQDLVFDSLEYSRFKDNGCRIIHWLPAEKKDDLFEAEVVMPDGTKRKGLGEPSMSALNQGDIVQLERFGFCRLDEEQGNKLLFWFAHK